MTMMFKIAAAVTLVLAPLKAMAAVEIQEVTSPGGITAWLVEEESIPFVAIELRFTGGANLDLDGKRGATNLMMGLLEEGAGDRDAQAFAEAVEDIAAQFSFEAFNDSVSISAEFLTEYTDESVDLLREAIVNPNFDLPALDRVRGQVLAIIDGDARDPEKIASAELAKLAFPDHPYGSVLEGTVQSVSALTRDDMIVAHRNALTRDRVQVGVAGDISAEELAPLLDKLLGDLPASGLPEVSDADYALDGGVTVVDYPSPQSYVLFSQPSLDRADDDFFAAYILNHIMGGSGFASRLMEEVREKRGLTYGIGSFLVPRDHAAQHMGQFSSSNDTTAEAISIVRDIWADFAANGVTEDKLEAAKTYLTGAYALRFDGNARIARIMVGMQASDLPIDYIATRNDKINAVTQADIKRVAEKWLMPDDLHFVVIGQPDDLRSGALPEG